MAQIKMDVSEYKEMEKNAKLLEEALEREQKQQKKIEKLNQEKIEALENAAMSVTVINKTESVEHLLRRRDPQEVLQYLRQGGNRVTDSDFLHRRGLQDSYRNLDWISHSFWDTTTSKSENNKTVITKGLDEVKTEITDKIRKEFELNYQEEINDLKRLKKDLVTSKTELESLTIELAKSERDVVALTEENIQFEELIEAWEETEKEKNETVEEFKNKSINLFNAIQEIKKLKKIL